MSIRLKLVEKFKRLSMPQRILVIVLASPLLVVLAFFTLGLSTWLVSLFGLPIIGYGVSRHSWRAGKRSGDKKVFAAFALSVAAAVALFIVMRQPPFITDWEGWNPLDDLIMVMMLIWVLLLAAAWCLAGWVGHRIFMVAKVRKNRVAAPE